MAKKVQVVAQAEEEPLLINKPIVALIDHMQESEIANIVESSEAGYTYQADLHFSAENEYLNKIFEKQR